MKPTNVIKHIDDLGRIQIPKNMREKLFGGAEADYGTGRAFEVSYENDTVVLKPYYNKPERIMDDATTKALNNIVRDYKFTAITDILSVIDEKRKEGIKFTDADEKQIAEYLTPLSISSTEFCETIYRRTPTDDTYESYQDVLDMKESHVWEYPVTSVVDALTNEYINDMYIVRFTSKTGEIIYKICSPEKSE